MNSQSTLRLVYPQWQGAGESTVAELLPEIPLPQARRGYAVGTKVLEAILPPHDGPTAWVDVAMDDADLAANDGIEARSPLLHAIQSAQQGMAESVWERILILGGDCAVSIAPFAELIHRYGDDLAIIWIDSHPDVQGPLSPYDGFHAMAVATLIGQGDAEMTSVLPATIDPAQVALAGVHILNDDEARDIRDWGLHLVGPEELHESSAPLVTWLASIGCSRVAIHFDVDVIDREDLALGLGRESGGLTAAQALRIVTDLATVTDVVGLTIAEFIPRDVLKMQNLVSGMPLIS